jgi:hypothetical protein
MATRIQFKVTGAFGDTGESCSLSIYAADRDEAIRLANQQGIFVSKVEMVAIEEIPHKQNVSVVSDTSKPQPPCCPRCGSVNLSGKEQGFGVGKALLGGMLLGPLGVLAGAIGAEKIMVRCLVCGNKFSLPKKQ